MINQKIDIIISAILAAVSIALFVSYSNEVKGAELDTSIIIADAGKLECYAPYAHLGIKTPGCNLKARKFKDAFKSPDPKDPCSHSPTYTVCRNHLDTKANFFDNPQVNTPRSKLTLTEMGIHAGLTITVDQMSRGQNNRWQALLNSGIEVGLTHLGGLWVPVPSDQTNGDTRDYFWGAAITHKSFQLRTQWLLR